MSEQTLQDGLYGGGARHYSSKNGVEGFEQAETGPQILGTGAAMTVAASGWLSYPPPPGVNVPGLPLSQVERLFFIKEECEEVARACEKILRYGFDSRSPDASAHPRQKLGCKLGNLLAVISLAEDRGDVTRGDLVEGKIEKHKNLEVSARHQQT